MRVVLVMSFAMVVALAAPEMHAAEPVPDRQGERRQHFAIVAPSGADLYEVTAIVHGGEETWLVDDRGGPPLLLQWSSGMVAIEQPESRSRIAVMSEEAGTLLTVDVNGLRRSARREEWLDGAFARKTRVELRPFAEPRHREAMERLRDVVAVHPRLGELCERALRFVLHDETCTSAPLGTIEPRPADCDFDRKHGYPCSREPGHLDGTRSADVENESR